MSPPTPDIVQQVDSAFYWIGGICAVLLIGVTVAMIAFVARYHRSRQPDPTSRAEGNTVLEVTWIVIPTIIVLVMFWIGYVGFQNMRTVPPGAMVLP